MKEIEDQEKEFPDYECCQMCQLNYVYELFANVGGRTTGFVGMDCENCNLKNEEENNE